MATATITGKNQITIPREVRRELQLKRGDRVTLETGSDGSVVLRKKSAPRKSDGAAVRFMRKKVSLTVDEMKKVVAEAAAKKYRRSSR
jgi:AbrB family looped-hinge helix DNA binding protein